MKTIEIDSWIGEMIVRERFSGLLKDNVNFMKRQALNLYIVRIENMELCL